MGGVWFGSSGLFFKGISGEQFLFSFAEVMMSCHVTHGDAQIPSCGFPKGDSLNSRGALAPVGRLASQYDSSGLPLSALGLHQLGRP